MSENDPATPDWADVFRRYLDARLMDVHTALPGQVEAYDPATQLADIKPLIRRTLRQEGTDVDTSEPLPVIPSVPVGFLRTGTAFISMPVKKGQTGQLIFNERALDRFRSLGEDSEPGDNRMHGLSGAFFLPVNLVPRSDVLASVHADDIVVGFDGGVVLHVKESAGEIHAGSPSAADFVALAGLVDTNFTTLLNLLQTWTVALNDGGGALQVAANLLSTPTVAASKLKAD